MHHFRSGQATRIGREEASGLQSRRKTRGASSRGNVKGYFQNENSLFWVWIIRVVLHSPWWKVAVSMEATRKLRLWKGKSPDPSCKPSRLDTSLAPRLGAGGSVPFLFLRKPQASGALPWSDPKPLLSKKRSGGCSTSLEDVRRFGRFRFGRCDIWKTTSLVFGGFIFRILDKSSAGHQKQPIWF